MKMRLELDIDNAAFEDDPRIAIGDLLLTARDKIQHRDMHPIQHGDTFKLRDINGNTVGTVKFEEE